MSGPKLNVTYLAPHAIRPDPRNPRQHGKRHVRQLAKSIEAFGFNVPVLVDEDRQLVAGHRRHAAALLLGLAEVPTISVAHLSPTQRQAFMIADNRLSDVSRWNNDLLGQHLLELAEADLSFDIEAVGFSVAEIDLLSAVGEGETDDALPPTPPSPPVSRPGDRWELGRHRLLCASALADESYPALLGSDKVDVVVGDPPFNVPIAGHVSGLGKHKHREFAEAVGELTSPEFTNWLERSFRLAARWSREGSLHYWAMDWRHLLELTLAARAVYAEPVNLCVWTKTSAGMGSFYRSQHELFAVWRNGRQCRRNNVQLGRFGRSRSNVWSYPGCTGGGRTTEEGNLLALHPTVKPVALVMDVLLDCTKRGDLVLDPFLGSGTTLIAAEKSGRSCRGIELDPLYVDTAVRRWQRWTGETARRTGDGASFDALEAATLGEPAIAATAA